MQINYCQIFLSSIFLFLSVAGRWRKQKKKILRTEITSSILCSYRGEILHIIWSLFQKLNINWDHVNECINDHRSGNLFNINSIFKLLLIEHNVREQNDVKIGKCFYIKSHFREDYYWRLRDQRKTAERLFREIRGRQIKFPWAPAAQTKRFHFNSNPPGVDKLKIKQTKPWNAIFIFQEIFFSCEIIARASRILLPTKPQLQPPPPPAKLT